MARAAGLQTSIWNNNLLSVLLLAVYPLIIIGLIWVIAYLLSGVATPPQFVRTDDPAGTTTWTNVTNPELLANNVIIQYWPAILTAVTLWFIVSYFWNTAMIRAMTHAHPVSRKDEPELYNMLENLCIAEGMKIPHLNIIETDALNAFASGVDDRSYTVTVTRGLMNALAPDELEAVIGHELAHIINRDVRLLMICVIFTGMVGFAAQMAWHNVRYGMMMGRRRGGNQGGGLPVMLVITGVLWIGYLATLFTRFAVSRRREFMADAGAVQMTRNPEAMMRALMRISGRDHVPAMPADVAMMCIENRKPFMGLFATHPPIDKRIAALARLARVEVPATLPPVRRPGNPWAR
jgi:heat shock protein HtpX